MNNSQSVLMYLVLGLLCVFVAFRVYVYQQNRDFVERGDVDLLYTQVTVPDDQNGFVLLRPVLRDIRQSEPYEGHRDFVERVRRDRDKYQDRDVWKMLEKYENLLGALDEAVQRLHFQIPAGTDIVNRPENFYRVLLFAGTLQEFAIERSLTNKDFNKAARQIQTLLRLGHLLQLSDGGITTYLSGHVFKGNALEKLEKWIRQVPADLKMLREYGEDIEPYLIDRGLETALRMEYTQLANTVILIDTKGRKDPQQLPAWMRDRLKDKKRKLYLFNPNKTLNMIAANFRRGLQNLDRPFAEMEPIERPGSEFRHKPVRQWMDHIKGNMVGKIFAELTHVNFESLIRGHLTLEARCRLARLHLMLNEYEIEYGELPESLEVLVSAEMTEVPADPFTDGPIRYARDSKLLYSVGHDLQDDRGDEEKDIVVKLGATPGEALNGRGQNHTGRAPPPGGRSGYDHVADQGSVGDE